MELTIAEAILVHILVISSPVEGELLGWCIDQTQLATSLVSEVVLLVEVLVIDKAPQSAVETSHTESQLLAGTMVVSHLYITIQTSTNAQTHISPLIIHGVLGIDANQSTLSVLSVEGALRTTQDIHTIQHIEMIIECRLRHQWDVIVIHTHSRIVDTRTNTTHIH